MKKIIFFLSMICFFTGFTSFAPPPAVVTDTHSEGDITTNITNPCNGENIAITGHEVYDFHAVQNANRTNVSLHAQGHYDGTGNQGNTYNGHAYYNITQNVPNDNGAYTLTYVYRVLFVSQGGAPNFTYGVTLKITVNANGTVTVLRSDPYTECRG